jgi:hypothetical protein
MRLLNVNTHKLDLVEFFGDQIPLYAILSHTWGNDEVTFQDLQRGHYEHKLGFTKIRLTCQQAKQDGLSWCWVDTCCIDKSSSAELSEAINSMYNWYARAQVCYAYLADVCSIVCLDPSPVTRSPSPPIRGYGIASYEHTTNTNRPRYIETPARNVTKDVAFRDSRWFRRGWTLQELIAPRRLKFFGRSWEPLGERDAELLSAVTNLTGLSGVVVGNHRVLRDIPIAQRMSWMTHRRTTRKEDETYCLLGIFEANMPLLYGEEDMAFLRLQEELIKKFPDHSLLIFSDLSSDTSRLREGLDHTYNLRNPLAYSPQAYRGCSHVEVCKPHTIPFVLEPCHLTNFALHISLPLLRMDTTRWTRDLALLGYTVDGIPIALVLMRRQRQNAEDIWFVCHYDMFDFLSQDVVEIPSVGTRVVAIPEELAVTAKREMVVIGRDFRFADSHLNPKSNDAWLRYDLALMYESGMPDLVPLHTITRQWKARTPHMIRVKDLLSFPRKVAAIAFSSVPTTIIVALTHHVPWGNIRGALLAAEGLHLESKEQLLGLGTDLMKAKLKEPCADTLAGVGDSVTLASIPLREDLSLVLQKDGYVGDRTLGQIRLTLRIQDRSFESRLFSDGFRE